ncbi:MAG: bifunctional oligoribonuclease/PAP phosphatase NrnA [Ignavibacteriales bacterium]|nr:bifunctional oligoribonuclease/PAP phosphatase NrnA [Ignavibacteriales bacterium]
MKNKIEEIKELINRFHNFVITTHVNPDGDALGSELALYHALRLLDKNAVILNHNSTPDNYKWMDDGNRVLHFIPEKHRDYILNADVIFILDANQPDRLRSLEPFIKQTKAIKIVIDHHLDPHPFGDHYLIDDEATSTGEILYKLISTFDTLKIEREIAVALYTAIMTDTGSFRFPRTDPETHNVVSHLLECGADPTQIYMNVYENWTCGRMRLLGEALDTLKTVHSGKVAYIKCTQEMFKETGTTEVETDNFTMYPMSIQGVLIGILFNELNNGIKISFRSKGNIPINELAKEFGGNGHLNAAGARLFDKKLEDMIPLVLEKSLKYLQAEI